MAHKRSKTDIHTLPQLSGFRTALRKKLVSSFSWSTFCANTAGMALKAAKSKAQKTKLVLVL